MGGHQRADIRRVRLVPPLQKPGSPLPDQAHRKNFRRRFAAIFLGLAALANIGCGLTDQKNKLTWIYLKIYIVKYKVFLLVNIYTL